MATPRACIDRHLPPDFVLAAAGNALRENPANAPILATARELLPGVMYSEFQVAALTGKLWMPGRRLPVRFLDGDSRIHERCIPYAKLWEPHANIVFDFGNDPEAEIRISFRSRGSWSYVGTDCLTAPPNEATMNFGWLELDTPTEEYGRVVTHEFGHALALIHEHQNPAAAIPWNKEAVYAFYQGSPNYWTREQVDINVFTRYSADMTRHSDYDPASIMSYPIPVEFVNDISYAVGWNKVMSPVDKAYIARLYPRAVAHIPELIIDGPRIQGSIGARGEVDTYTFTIARTGAYRLETYGNLDTVMALYGPNTDQLMVAKDDDSGGRKNARIGATLLPGRYNLRVHHFSARGVGAYEIALRSEEPAAAPQRFG